MLDTCEWLYLAQWRHNIAGLRRLEIFSDSVETFSDSLGDSVDCSSQSSLLCQLRDNKNKSELLGLCPPFNIALGVCHVLPASLSFVMQYVLLCTVLVFHTPLLLLCLSLLSSGFYSSTSPPRRSEFPIWASRTITDRTLMLEPEM